MKTAESVVETVAADFAHHFGRAKTGSLQLTGNPAAGTALVTIGTIGDTALELLEDDGDLLIVRVHAYRPFPAARLTAALAGARHVCVVDRAAAFGSFGPLGGDVRALRLPGATGRDQRDLRHRRHRGHARHAALGAPRDAVERA